uniref:Uncharacterized protein n=1 Tax=Glossina palpalis gambiensis TaxID=67801 RepID=A0A1B0B5I0_9MUSC
MPVGVDEFVHKAVVSRLGDTALLRIPLITLAPLHKLAVPVAVSVAFSTFVFEGSRSRKVAVDDLPDSRSVALLMEWFFASVLRLLQMLCQRRNVSIIFIMTSALQDLHKPCRACNIRNA